VSFLRRILNRLFRRKRGRGKRDHGNDASIYPMF